MILPVYREQVDLLLRILPFVAQESCFALKGGTAINLFLRDMPRLSVDIDLVYLPFDKRETALGNISEALERIRLNLTQSIPGIQVQADSPRGKLLCLLGRVQVKVEVNMVMRGHIEPARLLPVADVVQGEFGKFSEILVVSDAELYGGKICAALDRQHPRDLFDVLPLIEQNTLPDAIQPGFIASLLSHDRPLHEVIRPRFQDQEQAFQAQFAGMARTPFTYEDYINTRIQLVDVIHASLSNDDKALLISFKQGKPDWSLSPIKALQDLPAVQWKLQNIQKLARENPIKHQEMLKRLEESFRSA
ncbi:MAG: nucleotidyl transferase AbiEii/AbiGii toxin family protein [Oligoflexales bacterium]